MLLCALSGILLGTTFVFNKLCFLSLFALIPFVLSISKEGRGFLKGVVFSVCLNGVALSFFFYMHPMEFMGYSGLKSIVVILLMYLGVLAVEGMAGGVFGFVFDKYIKNLWLFPFFYCLYEIITGAGELGLTFSHLYLPWYKNLAFIQSASIFSCYFLTLLIAYINIFIYKGIFEKKKNFLLLAAALLVLNISFGELRLNTVKLSEPKVNAALIQGNISSLEKWENNSISDSFEVYERLTKEAKEKYNLDIVIWPETVINTPVGNNGFWYKKISQLASDSKVEIMAGAFYGDREEYYNSLIVFDKNGKAYDSIYYKRHLIPFAENMYSEKSGLREGKNASVLNTASGKVGALICIDSAYPYLSYNYKNEKCDYLVVATNDSWFSDSFGVENHFAHSVFRAVENKKYLFRAGNTGITAVITPFGEVKGILEPLVRGYTVYKGGEVTNEKK